MWRVGLSAVAIVIDAGIVALMGLGLSMSTTSVQVTTSDVMTPVPATANNLVLLAVVSALFGLNILAILFGARLKLPGNRLKAVSSVFE